MSCELWLARMGRHIDLLSCSSTGWADLKTLPIEDVTVTCLCVVNDSVWLGDSRAVVHIYGLQTYTEVSSFSLTPDCATVCALRGMLHLESVGRVALFTGGGGRLWLCHDNSLHGDALQELDAPGALSLCALQLGDNGCELWCGKAQGAIAIYPLRGSVVSGQEVVNHYEPPQDNFVVSCLCSSSEGQPTVWSYVYPGCVVYQWDCASRSILHRLDCSKLAPCSESLLSISIEEHLTPGRCQVTTMALVDTELYVGTTWGCLVVAEASTMRPITVFRPFEEEVKAILCLPPDGRRPPATQGGAESPVPSQRPSALVATVGKGYRNLLGRYLPTGGDCLHQNMHAILWRTDPWAEP